MQIEILDSARQSQIVLNEEDHFQIGKADEEEQFGKVAASPKAQDVHARGMKMLKFSRVIFFENLILVQIECWRRGWGMQVERSK